MPHSRTVVTASFAAALFLGAGLGETALATTTVGIGNASVAEGNSGTQALNFALTRGGDSTENIAVQYQTADHPTSPATADTDYVSISSTLALLPPGTSSLNLPVYIYGDTTPEANENFYLNLTSAHNAGPPLSFATTANFGAASVPRAAAYGDFNGDGKPDLAVANQNSNNVSVLLNTTAAGASTPTYAAAIQFPAGNGPYALAVGDVNGDGEPDLAVSNNSGNNLSVLLNTTAPGAATPTFSAAVNFALSSVPYSVSLSDLNGDGKPDLVVAIFYPWAVSVLLNTTAPGAATPTFTAAATFPVDAYAASVAVGDLNGDGLPDLAVSSYVDVSVLLNTMSPGATTPTFAAYTTVGIGAGADTAYNLALADVNGDGKLDLATANNNSANVSVMLNNTVTGGATVNFGTAVTFAAGSQPYGLLLRDLNGDGRPDLAVANFGGGNITVLYNAMPPGAAAPAFAPAGNFTVSTGPMTVAAADVNGDGLPDLAVSDAGGAVSVLMNTSTPAAPPPAFSGASNLAATTAIGVTAGDVNGDGKPDLFATYDGGIRAWMNTMTPGATTPSFSIASAFGAGSGTLGVALGDFNGDGKPDLAAANSLTNTVSVLLSQTGAGATLPSFQTASNFTVGSHPYDVAVADFNGDGKPDLVSADYSSSSVSILLNTTATGASTATFATAAGYGVGANQTTDVAVADFNGDGKPDIVATVYNNAGIDVLLNTTATGASTASFSAQTIFSSGSFPSGLATADLNGDGKIDVVTANQIGTGLSIFFNTTTAGAATPTFASAVNISGGGINAFKVRALDINGDGKPDLCVANYGTGNISVLTNMTPAGASTPTFASVANTYSTGTHIEDLALADFNGDGRPDLAGANYDGNSVSVLLNQLYAVSLSPSQGTGTIVDDDTDPTPDAIAFTSQTNVPFNTPITSNTVTITGINVTVGISVTAGAFSQPVGEYSIGCTGTFTTANGTVNNGDTVCVRQTSAGTASTASRMYLYVSNLTAPFDVTTEATDTTPFAFAFTDAAGVTVGSVQESNVVTITGINTATAVSVSGGEYRKNGGSYGTATGSVVNGDTVQVRHTASLMFSTATDTTLTVGGVSDTFTSTTEAQDTTPDAFSFTDATNAALGSVQESNVVTIGGINSPSSVSVSGGEYRIDGGTYTTTAATVQAGHTLQVRHTASATPATTVNTTLTVGGVSDTFSSTTVPVDTTPDAFAFTDQAGVALGSTQTSNTIAVSGINSAASISVTGGGYSIGCTATFVTSAGTINNGQSVCVQHTASATPATTTDTTLTIGGVSDTFSSTTVPPDTTPAAFSFTDQGNVTPGSTVTSDTVTVSGINTGAPISVTGGSYRIGNGTFTTGSGTVQNGQTVQLQHTASSSFATATNTTLTIGGVSDTFTSTTAAQDVTPNAFTFTDVTGVATGSVQESSIVTIAGITGAVAVTVSGGEYRKNGGAYTAAAGTVVNGDTLQLRQTASSTATTTTTAMLTVGTVSDSWSVTTAAAPAAGGGGGGGPLSPVTLLLLGLAALRRVTSARAQGCRR